MIARLYGGQTRCLIGFPDQGALLCDAGVSHARARSNPHSLTWALVGSGLIRIILRDTDEAERLLREALDLAHEHRMPQWIGFAQALLGFALCSNGDPQTGIKLQDEGMRSLHAAGSMLGTTRLRVDVAASLIGIGELERARLHLVAGQSHRESHGEDVCAAELERVEAKLLRAEGAPSGAVAAQLDKAISTARSQNARLFELRAATSLAQLWRDEGRRAEASGLLAPIYGWFTEGFAMPDLKEAKALLEELG